MSIDKWTSEQIEEFEEFYQIAKKRLARGESEESARAGLKHIKKK